MSGRCRRAQRKPPMRTDYLRYFLDVAHLGSITLAAERHFMSPQGISRAITVLEGELGSRLFKRSHNSVTLTQAGAEFLPYARQMVSLEQQAQAHLAARAAEDASDAHRLLVAYCSHVAFDTPLFYPLADGARNWFGRARFLQLDSRQVVAALLRDADAARQGAAKPGADAGADTVSFGLLCLFDVLGEANGRALADLKAKGLSYVPLLQTHDLALHVGQESPGVEEGAFASRPEDLSAGGVGRSRPSGAAGIRAGCAVRGVDGSASSRMRLALMDEAVTFIPGFSLVVSIGERPGGSPLAEPVDAGGGRRGAFRGAAKPVLRGVQPRHHRRVRQGRHRAGPRADIALAPLPRGTAGPPPRKRLPSRHHPAARPAVACPPRWPAAPPVPAQQNAGLPSQSVAPNPPAALP